MDAVIYIAIADIVIRALIVLAVVWLIIDAASDDSDDDFDFVDYLHQQRDFSQRTFGPGMRTKGIVDHITKELREIDDAPNDLTEWIDVVMLGLDGAWRAGHEPEQIAQALKNKLERNKARNWPDWRTADPDKAIEHVRDGAA